MKKSNAFTIIELVFVIVVLGILSAVALPKFSKTKENADIAKGRSDVASIRSSILTERQSQIIKGVNTYIPKLCSASTDTTLFLGDGAGRTLLTYGIVASNADGKWSTNGSCTSFNFKVASVNIQFDYNATTGSFTCDRANGTTGVTCKKMVD